MFIGISYIRYTAKQWFFFISFYFFLSFLLFIGRLNNTACTVPWRYNVVILVFFIVV